MCGDSRLVSFTIDSMFELVFLCVIFNSDLLIKEFLSDDGSLILLLGLENGVGLIILLGVLAVLKNLIILFWLLSDIKYVSNTCALEGMSAFKAEKSELKNFFR